MPADLGPLAAGALVAAASAGVLPPGIALPAAIACLAAGWRRSGLWVRAAAALLLVAAVFFAWRSRGLERRLTDERGLDTELRAVQQRAREILDGLQRDAAAAAALPAAREVLAGRADASAPAFRALEGLRVGRTRDVALALHRPDWSPVAWSGRTLELVPFRQLIGARDVFALEGSISTTLVAAAPVAGAAGAPLGYASAELTVSTRRNVHNEYLRDFDMIADNAPNVEIQYVDLRDTGPADHDFPALPAEVAARMDLVKTPSGTTVAAVRVTPPRIEKELSEQRAGLRRALSALALLLLGVWAAARPLSRARVLGLVSLLRLSLLGFGPPWPAPGSPLLSPDVYSAAPAAPPALALLSALFRSPLDLLFTALALLAACWLLLDWAAARAPQQYRAGRALPADALALPLVGLVFLLLADVVAKCSLDLEDVAIVPQSAAIPLMHAALLALLGAGGALLTALLTLAGPFPTSARAALPRLSWWALLVAAALRYWPREHGLPLVPTLVFFLSAAVAARQARRWRERLLLASLDARAGLCVLGVAGLALLLFPSLVHFDEKNLRRAVEQTHAPLVLRQPEWRDYVLRETRRKIDDLGLLETEPQGPHPPEIEELAYAVWSATDLAGFGFTSAIEIQDPLGYVVSRFALNLPSISGNSRPLPKSTDWTLQRERSTVGSAERPVVHASRLLAYEGRVRGAVHVFVGDDFWNLPFLESRDPYSALFRRGLDTQHHTRPLGLLVYDPAGGVVFSSDERPPSLDPLLLQRVRASPRGLWTTLGAGARRQHAFLVADAGAVYAISYARTDAPRYLADLIEAVLSLTLLALLTLLSLMLLRTLLRRRELSIGSAFAAVNRRFALRLFVAFMLVAIVPVLVLQKVVERFVTDRLRAEGASQALELAAVAKKAVEDYALFQRDEAPGQQPVSDAALVWVASLIQNDLDVFERGRLLASSKRELYASGLLPQRLSGEVHRALELDGESSSLRNESIGGFSYQVVSVPLLFEGGGRGVLQIPLALRQREVEAVVEDLLRTIRLASLLFLAAAAGLAVSMSRQFSGPLHALIAATHRVAAGDFGARVRPRSRDELHTLVDSFNRMAQDLEQQRTDLERTNKLAAWADMARQVAHEVKNPLTPIQLATEHLRRVYADKSADFGRTLQSCTDTILEQVQTLREIVTEFSSFARPPAPTLERVELQPLVTQVARAYQDVLPREVTLELLPGGSPAVAADRRLLERAVVNLVENALQAVGDAGAVRLRVLEDGQGRAVVEVEDSGPGLDPETKARIFEPFFSTKASGSGLGLALVKKIAEDHGGGVSLDSAPGEATRARLWFPPAP